MYTSCGQTGIHDPALIQNHNPSAFNPKAAKPEPHGLGFRLVWFRVEVLGLFGSGLRIWFRVEDFDFRAPKYKTLRA